MLVGPPTRVGWAGDELCAVWGGDGGGDGSDVGDVRAIGSEAQSSVWSRLISSRFVSFRLVSSRFVSFRLVSSRFVSFCLVLSRFVSSRLVCSHHPRLVRQETAHFGH
ncbi:unnamed protein product [Protopolystoma xenopodis]|uniref:Uncharacterized protein n=1 Tax=Protopolystoma xenopodis TaxID=117903 RepID=A0A448XAF7_9PLAT|nr:unnamed protein product [Protopolystoma xenopodis]